MICSKAMLHTAKRVKDIPVKRLKASRGKSGKAVMTPTNLETWPLRFLTQEEGKTQSFKKKTSQSLPFEATLNLRDYKSIHNYCMISFHILYRQIK